MAASSVDAMLKAKGFTGGTLNDRIKAATAEHLITSGMSQWAHLIRLDANASRHADEKEPHRTAADAQRYIAFAKAPASTSLHCRNSCVEQRSVQKGRQPRLHLTMRHRWPNPTRGFSD